MKKAAAARELLAALGRPSAYAVRNPLGKPVDTRLAFAK